MKPGVYQIENRTTGKKYIGSSSNTHRRLSEHWNLLNGGRHSNEHLMYAWRKYGDRDFDFEVIKHFDTVEEARAYEQELLDEYRLNNRWQELYNKAIHVENVIISEEQKKKISESLKGNSIYSTLSDETKLKIRQAVSEAKTGIPRKEETKRKISESLKGRPAHNKGKKVSEELRKKMSETRKGIKQSDERKKKTSEAIKTWWAERKALKAKQTNPIMDNKH
jgi:predicted GIY-YIG superfamily endonuclease